jgi:ribose transport system substrate-binding protein
MRSTDFNTLVLTMVGTLSLLCGTSTKADVPQIVSGPGADPDCFKPWSDETKCLVWPTKSGPYRIALVNGFIGNTWRIQMIKTAKAYADQPAVKSQLKEFKVVSTEKISRLKLPRQITSSIRAMMR